MEISDNDMRRIMRYLPHIRDKTLRGENSLRLTILILYKLVRRYKKENFVK